jgi:two-component system chemotaxis response regulator CheB
VLVVEDEVIFRRALSRCLAGLSEDIEVQTATTVVGARRRIETERFDLVTLDLTLADGDGTELLRWMKRSLRAPPVVVVTSGNPALPTEVDAILMGAARMIQKPGGSGAEEALRALLAPLVDEIRRAPKGRPSRGRPTPVPHAELGERVSGPPSLRATRGAMANHSERPVSALPREVIAVGASTGGPAVITALLRGLGAGFSTPVLVTQHMQSQHIRYFIELLRSQTGRDVRLAADGEALEPGRTYVAGGPGHLTVARRDGRLRVRIDDGPEEHHVRPAVDPLFRSVAEECGAAAVGVVISGMGSDGAQGALAMRQRGAVVIAQDEATSAVWGMPGATVIAGAADVVAPAKDLADWVKRATQGSAANSAQGRR